MDELIKILAREGLQSKAIQDAFIKYIEALTEAKKRPDGWREVWYRKSETRTYETEQTPQIGVHPTVVLKMTAWYSSSTGVGLICAFITFDNKWDTGCYEIIFIDTNIYKDYPRLIDRAIELWPDAYQQFTTLTKVIE